MFRYNWSSISVYYKGIWKWNAWKSIFVEGLKHLQSGQHTCFQTYFELWSKSSINRCPSFQWTCYWVVFSWNNQFNYFETDPKSSSVKSWAVRWNCTVSIFLETLNSGPLFTLNQTASKDSLHHWIFSLFLCYGVFILKFYNNNTFHEN